MRGVALLALLLVSCGYRLGDAEGLRCSYESICVPIACGDQEGALTGSLIDELHASGWDICGSELTLEVSICDTHRRNIGFQYDLDEEGFRTQRIVPNEGRLHAKATVSVVETATGCVVRGPSCIEYSVDYDFNPLSTDTELSVFSIGQFNNIDEAEEAARLPLYRGLARKIVDYVEGSW